MVSIRCVFAGVGVGEQGGGGVESLLISHSGDGDACGLRNTPRLPGLVGSKGLLLRWRKSGSGRSAEQRFLILGVEDWN